MFAPYSRSILLRQLWPYVLVSMLSLLITLAFVASSAEQQPRSVRYFGGPVDESSSSNNNLSYGIIVDAGSSGSRVYLYCWPPHSGRPDELLTIRPVFQKNGRTPVVKKVSPGLSSFADRPADAPAYLKPLLDLAAEHIPVKKQSTTPLFVLATAGMRLLTDEQQNVILGQLRSELPKLSNFKVEDGYVEVISGKWEGIFSWIAVNYILKRLDHSQDSVGTAPRTVGMIDMGGASVQIAFEMDKPIDRGQEHLVEKLNLGCREHDASHEYLLYVTTFLGFGANEAQQRYEQRLLAGEGGPNPNVTVSDPCFPVSLLLSTNGTAGRRRRKGLGRWRQCVEKVTPLISDGVSCDSASCSINGVHQPNIDFGNTEFYGFSEYWYSLEDVLGLGKVSYDYDLVRRHAEQYCSLTWSTIIRRHRTGKYPKADMSRLKNQCFKSAWVTTVLHDGFGFPKIGRLHFQPSQTIENQEVQWTLGAMLYRMRLFPLRAVQLRQLEEAKRRDERTMLVRHYLPSSSLSWLLLLLCFAVVSFVAVRYLAVLRRPMFGRTTSSPMRRNYSMWSYMTLNEDRNGQQNRYPLDGLRIETSTYVY